MLSHRERKWKRPGAARRVRHRHLGTLRAAMPPRPSFVWPGRAVRLRAALVKLKIWGKKSPPGPWVRGFSSEGAGGGFQLLHPELGLRFPWKLVGFLGKENEAAVKAPGHGEPQRLGRRRGHAASGAGRER